MTSGRIVLLLTSPRTAPGLLTWPAWEQLRAADAVLAADPDPEWVQALTEAGCTVRDVAAEPVGHRASLLVAEAAAGRQLVWLGSADADPGLTDALAAHLSRLAVADAPPEIEVLTGSYDVPGARLLDLVAVMDRLRSPAGCPWDAEQTHTSLLPYLLEEAHEVIEAVERGDRTELQEELGDLLLQVVFHARVAQEDPRAPFDIDDVAAGIVAKLVRRHPHVFAAGDAATAGEVAVSWDELKAAEKPDRGPLGGIPPTLPALARAQKVLARLERAGLLDEALGAVERDEESDELSAALLSVVLRAHRAGVDAESVLRAAAGRLVTPADPVS